MQRSRKNPLRPPIIIDMLRALRTTLRHESNPFDACVWAMAACAFWGLMRFGEVAVPSWSAFKDDPSKFVKRSEAAILCDPEGNPYIKIELPWAKTASPGESQPVFIVAQEDLCPVKALANLIKVVPANASDHLFSWMDKNGEIRPMVKARAIGTINAILTNHGWGTTFGHSFRIQVGGASFFLAQGVNPEVVRLAGRWKSMAYETYIRVFEQVASRHLRARVGRASNMPQSG